MQWLRPVARILDRPRGLKVARRDWQVTVISHYRSHRKPRCNCGCYEAAQLGVLRTWCAWNAVWARVNERSPCHESAGESSPTPATDTNSESCGQIRSDSTSYPSLVSIFVLLIPSCLSTSARHYGIITSRSTLVVEQRLYPYRALKAHASSMSARCRRTRSRDPMRGPWREILKWRAIGVGSRRGYRYRRTIRAIPKLRTSSQLTIVFGKLFC